MEQVGIKVRYQSWTWIVILLLLGFALGGATGYYLFVQDMNGMSDRLDAIQQQIAPLTPPMQSREKEKRQKLKGRVEVMCHPTSDAVGSVAFLSRSERLPMETSDAARPPQRDALTAQGSFTAASWLRRFRSSGDSPRSHKQYRLGRAHEQAHERSVVIWPQSYPARILRLFFCR